MTTPPFNDGTKLAQVFTILADGEWHCGKHELPGTQPAKAIQIIRQHGFSIENKTIFCATCKDKTVHRRLVSTEPTKQSIARQQFPAQLRKRVLQHYNNIEAITLREMIPNELEVDHRFPQVRWSRNEVFDPNMSESQLRAKFQILTRQHNLWKSRYCENCVKTSERGTFIGINFFAKGTQLWDKTYASDDERGCEGCFWYDPQQWREALNRLIDKCD